MTKKPKDTSRNAMQSIVEAITKIVGAPASTSETKSTDPEGRAKTLTFLASGKAAFASGAMAIPPGPIGMFTVIPDLLYVWNIQRQLVSDIAGAYGKQAKLSPETMIYCLFEHTSIQAVRDLIVRVGERITIKKTTLKMLQGILKQIGIKITQRILAKSASRWIPIIGAIGVGAYAFYDTRKVGKTAIELFSKDFEIQDS